MKINEPTAHLRKKIYIYLLLSLLIILLSGLLTWRYYLAFDRKIQVQNELLNSNQLLLIETNELVTCLSTGQEAISSYLKERRPASLTSFRQSTEEAQTRIQKLSKDLSDPAQKEALQSISSILQKKSQWASQLSRLFNVENPYAKVETKIEEKKGEVAPPKTKPVIKVVERRDTIYQKKKGFWKRFGEVFVPQKSPAIEKISRVIKKDSVITLQSDTILMNSLESLTSEANEKYQTNMSNIEQQINRLIVSEHDFTRQISTLLLYLHWSTIDQFMAISAAKDQLLHQANAIITLSITLGLILLFIFGIKIFLLIRQLFSKEE